MKMIETQAFEPLPPIRIAFLDVGQADTIVVTCPETHEAIVVDCVNPKAVLDYLTQEKIMYLRGIIITHLHADHYSGTVGLLENYHRVPDMMPCEVVVFNKPYNQKLLHQLLTDDDPYSTGDDSTFTAYRNLIDWHKRNKLRYTDLKAQAGQPFTAFTGTLIKSFRLLHPYAADYEALEGKGLNNTSIVLRIAASNSSALLMGDIEPEGWNYLQQNHENLHSDVLKFPHHGAWKNADAETFLDTIQPKITIISVGSEGYERYQHPNEHVLAALAKRPHIRVLCTQATEQCQRLVLNARQNVLNTLKAQAGKSNHTVLGSKAGCPCAGTIIVELSDHAQVLQPEMRFHQEEIIKPHFALRKCNI